MRVVGVPTFEEEETIGKVVVKAQRYVDRVVVVDDGGGDYTGEIAESLGATVLRHPVNQGYGEAISSLFKYAYENDVDVLITLDGDGQHDPDDIPALLEGLQGADMVIGSRFLVGSETDVSDQRRFGIEVITRIVELTAGLALTDAQSGFRAYNRKAIEVLRHAVSSGMGMSVETLSLAIEKKLKIVEVPISCRYAGLRSSTYNPWRHGFAVLATVFQVIVEAHPLRWLGVPAVIFTILGGLFGSYAVTFFLRNRILLVNYTILSVGFLIYGAVLFFAAINFYVLSRIRTEIRKN